DPARLRRHRPPGSSHCREPPDGREDAACVRDDNGQQRAAAVTERTRGRWRAPLLPFRTYAWRLSHRQLERAGQYFGPANSSSRATAFFLATEMVFGFEKRHSTLSQSRV